MRRPRLLDLFSGAGGCTAGYQRAGFWVRGVDKNRQPRYVGEEFVQADALEYLEGLIESGEIEEFDAIHASPPCQAHTSLKTMHNARQHEDLIPATRALLVRGGKPWVIENVMGAPLGHSILLCGTMFNLGCEDAELRRHRIFESNLMLFSPSCRHGQRAACLGVYGGHLRNRQRTIGVYGEGVRDSVRKLDKGRPDFNVEQGRQAMGINWMTIAELCQAIPPAYTELIGRQLMQAITRLEEAA